MKNRYTAAVVSIAIAVVAAVAQLGDGVVTASSAVQLALVGVGALGVYLLPLTTGKWAASLKVSLAVATAVLTAVAPLVLTGHVTGVQVAVVVLAALQAVGAQVGVDARVDAEQGDDGFVVEP